MSRQEALRQLKSANADERLRAARFLAEHAEAADQIALREVLANEGLVWVRTALRHAIGRATGHESVKDDLSVADADRYDQILSIAVHETTRRLVHEIAPILGVLELKANQELPNFDKSQTKQQIDRLVQVLDALDRLSRASAMPIYSEFDIAELIRQVLDAETQEQKAHVEAAGPSPLVVLGDRTLIEIALSNGIRNALEVTAPSHQTPSSIQAVVTWGDTDRDYWVAILDWGPGPPLGAEKAFEIGTTTKLGHLGMGLATSKQSILSLSGSISLTHRTEDGGAKLEFRWPKSPERL